MGHGPSLPVDRKAWEPRSPGYSRGEINLAVAARKPEPIHCIGGWTERWRQLR